MKKCDCYHWREEYTYDTFDPMISGDRKFVKIIGECWGTKEKDRCNCKGDRTKCDFYANVRNKAKEELRKEKEKIIVSVASKAFSEIKSLIHDFWETEPIYYVGKEDGDETRFAKLCSCILEIIANVEDGSKTTVFDDIKTGLKQAVEHERKECE